MPFLRAILLGFMAALTLTGCSTGRQLRWYDGPPLPREQVAILKVQRAIFSESCPVEKIDGKRITRDRQFVRNNTRRIELLPGTHTLSVIFLDRPGHSTSNALLTATFKPGHTYELKAAQINESLGRTAWRHTFGGTYLWTAWILDSETKEIVAGRPLTE